MLCPATMLGSAAPLTSRARKESLRCALESTLAGRDYAPAPAVAMEALAFMSAVWWKTRMPGS